jgi:hypothetical protein
MTVPSSDVRSLKLKLKRVRETRLTRFFLMRLKHGEIFVVNGLAAAAGQIADFSRANLPSRPARPGIGGGS